MIRRQLGIRSLILACFWAAALAALAQCSQLATPEAHAKQVLDEIEQTRLAVDRFARNGVQPCASPGCIFVAVWDFDGTILDGDLTEGLTRNGQTLYAGLQEELIGRGLSPRYAGPGAFERYRRDYLALENRAGYATAYGFTAQTFAGARVQDIASAGDQVRHRFPPHFFASSIAILRALESRGVHNYIISASPDFFVKRMATALALPPERVLGIALESRGDRYTDRIVPPIHWGPGKVQRIQMIVEQERAAAGAKEIFVLAAFGNSPHTDGPMLSWVRNQTLPARHAISVMINGDLGPRIPGVLYVSQSATLGQSP
ncbi:MAG: haloacid dehalogenase-like hydrolase [Leptospirales bacterium]|nr:haloacid dehalogenase-like hydrolase [Leptospirales bacterium]